jgi:hypothetical protein
VSQIKLLFIKKEFEKLMKQEVCSAGQCLQLFLYRVAGFITGIIGRIRRQKPYFSNVYQERCKIYFLF